MKRKMLLAVLAVILIAAGLLVKTYSDAGELKTISPHFNGTQTLITGVPGAEDITIDHKMQYAYISSDNRFATLNGHQGAGGIYLLRLDEPQTNLVSIALDTPAEIHPHGISFFTKKGIPSLYVVDHTAGKHSIFLFTLPDTTFHLEKVFRDSVFMVSPNDVLAIDENRFYFTNDHGSHTRSGKMLEDYLRLKRSNVIYFNGKNYSVAAENISYANGINKSHDGKEVYVASTIGRCILVYARDTTTGKLTLKESIPLNTGVDNIEVDEHGNLWVACHPQMLTFVQHVKDTSNNAPSQVYQLTKNGDGTFTPEEILLSKGDDLSGSSVAAVSGNRMLVGSVLDDGILKCELR